MWLVSMHTISPECTGIQCRLQRLSWYGASSCSCPLAMPAEPNDPDGMSAAIADFGLSRALAFGQVSWGRSIGGMCTHPESGTPCVCQDYLQQPRHNDRCVANNVNATSTSQQHATSGPAACCLSFPEPPEHTPLRHGHAPAS